MHPLIRELVISKLLIDDPASARAIGKKVVRELASASRWDDCLDAAERLGLLPLTVELVIDAVPELLRTGRVATVSRWLRLSGSCEEDTSPLHMLGEAELALWEGDNERAQTLGEHAGRTLRKHRYAARGFITAARAAHLRGDKRAAARNLDNARPLSTDPATKSVALWLRFVYAYEADDRVAATQAIEHMLAMKSVDSAHVLRIHLARAYFAFEIDGDVSGALSEMDLAHPLLGGVQDPMLRTNYLNLLATLCCYRSEYERSLDVVAQLLVEASEAGIEFVVDHAMVTRAAAQTGLRRFAAAQRTLQELGARSSTASTFVLGQAALKSAYLKAAAANLSAAERILRDDSPASYPASAVGEWLGARALILAAAGHIAEARGCVAETFSTSSYLDAANLARLAEAIARASEGAPSAESYVQGALRTAARRRPL